MCVNQSTFSKFGAKFIGADRCAYFANPAVSDKHVHLIFDVCHMIKLLQNALTIYKSFVLPDKGIFSWDYTEKQEPHTTYHSFFCDITSDKFFKMAVLP